MDNSIKSSRRNDGKVLVYTHSKLGEISFAPIGEKGRKYELYVGDEKQGGDIQVPENIEPGKLEQFFSDISQAVFGHLSKNHRCGSECVEEDDYTYPCMNREYREAI